MVAAIGTQVTQVTEGQRVALSHMEGCGLCKSCIIGRSCIEIRFIGYSSDGGLAEYIVIEQSNVYVIPDHVSLEMGYLCSTLAGVEGIFQELGEIPKDANILIIGGGVIGILASTLLHHRGYSSVTICQRSETKRDMAKKLGFDYLVLSPEELAESFEGKRADIEGYDVVIDTTSNCEAIANAVHMMARRGKMALYGVPDGKLSIDGQDFFFKELTMFSIIDSPSLMSKGMEALSELARSDPNQHKLWSKVFDFEDYEKAIACMRAKEVIKAVLRVSNDK